ncbi:MAG TPA: TIGR00730 family Rossman fold protein [Candidatus Obscuribacterales bacterium]
MTTPSPAIGHEPLAIGPHICVFCGAAAGNDGRWAALAAETGRLIAAAGWTLVYGGGNTGLMGEVAQGALRAGGEVVGIMPELLVERERALLTVTRLETVPDLATRKQRMIELSQAFVVLPGGLGTLDELFEVLTWYQLGLHQQQSWVLNHEGFYDPLLRQLEVMEAAGFVHSHKLPLQVAATPAELIAQIQEALK